MQSNVCRGCRRPILDENNGKNIFDDNSLIKSLDYKDSYNKTWYMKLYSGIELITGEKVLKEEKLPQKLCEVCFKNVEAYINFRFQLLKSRDILLSSSYQESKSNIATKSVESNSLLLLNTLIPEVDVNDTIKKLPEITLFQNESITLPLISNTMLMPNFVFKTIPENLISINDNSTSVNVNSLHNTDKTTSIFLPKKLQNDYENNNFTELDTSVNNKTITNIQKIDIKQIDHDIESEIDVCSGDDDDVLELDVQKIKNETVEIQSSSESDIEVCDYEPIGKRGNYNALSQI